MNTTEHPKLWIARDSDKSLHIFYGFGEPQKVLGRWTSQTRDDCRTLCEVPNRLHKYQLYKDLDELNADFPNVKWEDEHPTELTTL